MSNPLPEPSMKPGERSVLNEAYDTIPHNALALVAKVFALGNAQGRSTGWSNYPLRGDKSPLNHGIRHAYEATSLKISTAWAIVKCAQAAANLLMQIDNLMRLSADDNIAARKILDDRIYYALKSQEQNAPKSDSSDL